MKTHLASGLALAIIVFAAVPAPASQWPVDESSDRSVSSAFNRQQDPRACSDGSGGAIVVWEDLRDEFSWNIWGQRVSGQGEVLWTTDGAAICTDPSNQTDPLIVSDGAGGAIVVWLDERNFNQDIYAQRVGADGSVLWAANGVPVTSYPDNQFEFEAIEDGSGGVVVVWTDMRTGTADIYAQRLDAAGSPVWTADGVAVCTAAGFQEKACAATDGAGGAIFAWVDPRGTDLDIFAQRIDAAGSAVWTVNGVEVVGSANDQDNPDIVPSLNNGAIVVWEGPGWTGEAGIFGKRVQGADGSDAWSNNEGRPLSTSDINSITDPVAVSDGSGGIVVAYTSVPFLSTYEDIHMFRIGPYSFDSVQWDVAVADNPSRHLDKRIVADGAGGAVVVWMDNRSGNQDIAAQRIDGNGNNDWDTDGVMVRLASGDQILPQVVGDSLGGGIMVWQDDADGPIDLNIKAHRIEGWGYHGYPSPTITTIEDVPLDNGNQVILSWQASDLDAFPATTVTEYGVWRKWLGTGAKTAGNNPVAPSRFEAATMELGKAGWSFVTIQAARWFAEYSLVVPTYGDSTGAGLSQTAFMVIAQTSNTWRFWSSAPDSGYSVDNLTPSAPLNLTGEIIGADALLEWQIPSENTEDIVSYSLYAAASPGVPPGPGTLIATTPELSWLDDAIGGMTRYYVVTATDDVGLESEPSNEIVLNGVSDISELPVEISGLALVGNFPNPFNPSTSIRFALPDGGGRVSLDIYRVDGGKVRGLLDGDLPGGLHEVIWRGDDDLGRTLPAGIYFATVRHGGESRTRKIVMVQ